MSIKNSTEIAREAAKGFIEARGLRRFDDESPIETFLWGMGEEFDASMGLEEFARRVIEVDRAQRDIYTMLADALEDRAQDWDECARPDKNSAAYHAAQALRGISAEVAVDTAWDDHIGPMLDRMEEEYGA